MNDAVVPPEGPPSKPSALRTVAAVVLAPVALLSAVLGLVVAIPLGLTLWAITLPAAMVRVRREFAAFRTSMSERGRLLTVADATDRLRRGDGTLILQADGPKIVPERAWWTAAKLTEPAGNTRRGEYKVERDFGIECYTEQLNEETGRALLIDTRGAARLGREARERGWRVVTAWTYMRRHPEPPE